MTFNEKTDQQREVLIELVAETIQADDQRQAGDDPELRTAWADESDEDQDEYRSNARAVLAALAVREEALALKIAAAREHRITVRESGGWSGCICGATFDTWQAADAHVAAREETHFDEVTISREEFEQIRRAQGFALFVAALDKPIAAPMRRRISLEQLIEKAQAALSAAREDTERPSDEKYPKSSACALGAHDACDGFEGPRMGCRCQCHEDTERPAEGEYDEQERVEAEAQAREP